MRLVLALLALLAIPAAAALDLYGDPMRRVQRGANAHDTLLAALGDRKLIAIDRGGGWYCVTYCN